MNKIEHKNQTNLKDGQFFKNTDDGHTYILAQVAIGGFQLIGLEEGNRFIDISKTLIGAFYGKFDEFIPVTQPFTITPQ